MSSNLILSIFFWEVDQNFSAASLNFMVSFGVNVLLPEENLNSNKVYAIAAISQEHGVESLRL